MILPDGIKIILIVCVGAGFCIVFKAPPPLAFFVGSVTQFFIGLVAYRGIR